MNLNEIAGTYTAVVNENVLATIRVSTGFTVDPTYKTAPAYRDFPNVPIQVQALDGPELAQIASLNIQGVTRAAYFNGALEGLDRPAGRGGDLILFGGRTWLVTKVFESWDSPGWTKVAITLQNEP